jgi:hypothetical protein
MVVPVRAGRYRLLLLLIIAVFYGGIALVWAASPVAYDRFLSAYNILPVHTPEAGPHAVPFFDLEGVISWSECARQGHNVYYDNPCDPAPYHRPANYSPLLVDLPLEWIGVRNSVAAGLVFDLLFLLVLPFVFRPQNTIELVIAGLACCSHATFYAVERTNIDVIVFLAIALALFASQRSLRGRMALYAVALGGALAKFYPLVLGAFALRERPRVLAAITVVFAVVMGLFAWHYAPEMAIVTHKIPAYRYFSDMFGAGALPLTLHRIFGIPDWAVRVTKLVFEAALVLFAIRYSGKFARIIPWQRREMLMLLAGALIMVGCFLLQVNNSYRAIFLMLTIPGLFRLSGRSDLARWAVWGALICLWAEVFRNALSKLGWVPLSWSLSILREGVWWYVVAVLAAMVLGFVRQSLARGEMNCRRPADPVSMLP